MQRILKNIRNGLANAAGAVSGMSSGQESALPRSNFDGVNLKLDYPIKPHMRPCQVSPGGRAITAMIDAERARHFQHLKAISELSEHLSAIPLSSEDPHAAAWINTMFPGLDAAFLYMLITNQKPARYIEIGSGTSTKFVRQAIRDHGLDTRIISIDPEPRADIDGLCDEVIRMPFEDVPASVFEQMSPRDIFFLDGSHRCFQNSDVTVFFTELLSAIPAGCFYGIHDIFLPCDYPPAWAERFYSEQYVLAAYLLGGANGDHVEFPAWHLCLQEESWAAIQNLFSWNKEGGIEHHGGAFWMRRKEY